MFVAYIGHETKDVDYKTVGLAFMMFSDPTTHSKVLNQLEEEIMCW
jgi:hypothetical protein